MCGIAGIISKTESADSYIEHFSRVIEHRGPNGAGSHIEGNRGFLNRRLAIVDIAGGNQPIYSEDKSKGIVFNGEIYNYNALKQDLLAKGLIFHTNSDTEVILRMYEAYGTESFARLNGMFAFCIWDDATGEVFVTRDAFGIKPLYFYEDSNKIIFSSELKAIISLNDVNLELDPAGFQDYLTFRYIQAPFTFYKNISRLDSGTYARIKNNEISRFRYRELEYNSYADRPVISVEEAKEELFSRLTNAVQSQLMGEVPIGVLLSGGVDSSAIAYIIHELGANLTTFNIGFPEVNEFQYSRAVANAFDLKHVELTTTADELSELLNQVVMSLDEPIADPACFPLYVLARELKKHVTVVLSGEGGDELFAGYPQHLYLHTGVATSDEPDLFNEFLRRSWYFLDGYQLLRDQHLPPHTLRNKKYFIDQPVLNGMLCYDLKTWMPDNLMMKADKIMMAHSLEGRFPFLDLDLFEFSTRLPDDFRISPDGTTKWLLKEAMKDKLPADIITRPKMGFTVPVDVLLKTFKPVVLDTADAAKKHAITDILNTEKIMEMCEEYYREGKHSHLQIWTLFILMYWFIFAVPRYGK